tara:strand:+ start:3907 stop:4302 length:396 start_codon:yes stop_codon:yes gene_type:complete
MDGENFGGGRQKNVLGGALIPCSVAPMTGFFRDGCCHTSPEDIGSHTVCAVMTSDFLSFSKAAGNDLMTPRAKYGFPGLKPGDSWCLCAARWEQARRAGAAPNVILSATNVACLSVVALEDLRAHAVSSEL